MALGMEDAAVSKPAGPCLHRAQSRRKDEAIYLAHGGCSTNVPRFVPFLPSLSQCVTITESLENRGGEPVQVLAHGKVLNKTF